MEYRKGMMPVVFESKNVKFADIEKILSSSFL